MTRYVFEIPGIPQSKLTPEITTRKTKDGQRYSTLRPHDKTVEFQTRVCLAAQRADVGIIEGPVQIKVYAIFPMKGAALKSKRRPQTWKDTKPDGSNVLKAVEDGLQGTAFLNDSQIVSAHVWTLHGAQGERARTVVVVESVAGAPRDALVPPVPALAQSEGGPSTG